MFSLAEKLESAITGRKAEETTVPKYQWLFGRFLRFIRSRQDLSQKPPFGKEHVDAFLTYLKKNANKGKGAKGNYLRWVYFSLAGMFKELQWEWPYEEHKKDAPKKSEPHQPYFNTEEMLTFLEAVERYGTFRDNALMFVAAACHPARIQLRNMNSDDYDRRAKTLHIRPRQKADLPGNPLLPEVTWRKLEEYLDSRVDGGNVMFFSERGGRLSATQLTRIFEKYLAFSGLPTDQGHGYHSLRRGMATIHFKAGMREKEIQKVGRWRTPYMPHLYIQLVDREVEEKRIASHPLFTRKEKKAVNNRGAHPYSKKKRKEKNEKE